MGRDNGQPLRWGQGLHHFKKGRIPMLPQTWLVGRGVGAGGKGARCHRKVFAEVAQIGGGCDPQRLDSAELAHSLGGEEPRRLGVLKWCSAHRGQLTSP